MKKIVILLEIIIILLFSLFLMINLMFLIKFILFVLLKKWKVFYNNGDDLIFYNSMKELFFNINNGNAKLILLIGIKK